MVPTQSSRFKIGSCLFSILYSLFSILLPFLFLLRNSNETTLDSQPQKLLLLLHILKNKAPQWELCSSRALYTTSANNNSPAFPRKPLHILFSVSVPTSSHYEKYLLLLSYSSSFTSLKAGSFTLLLLAQ